MGFGGSNLRFVGKGKFEGRDFAFEAPVSLLELEIEMKPDVDDEVAKINKDAMMPTAKAFRFEMGDITTDLGEDDSAIKSILKEQSEKAVREAYEEVWDGDFARLGKLPLESFLPMLLLK